MRLRALLKDPNCCTHFIVAALGLEPPQPSWSPVKHLNLQSTGYRLPPRAHKNPTEKRSHTYVACWRSEWKPKASPEPTVTLPLYPLLFSPFTDSLQGRHTVQSTPLHVPYIALLGLISGLRLSWAGPTTPMRIKRCQGYIAGDNVLPGRSHFKSWNLSAAKALQQVPWFGQTCW